MGDDHMNPGSRWLRRLARWSAWTAGAAALLVAATLGTAQIERLDLGQMVSKADHAVFGTIVDRQVIRIDHPEDGPELYFTTLTIEGRSLRTN